VSYRFLIVEQSATARAGIKRAIRRSDVGGPGATFVEAASGHEAMEALADGRVDLVLVDLRLPDMDAADLVGRVLAEPDTRGIPVVVIAARPDPAVLEALRRRGVKGHLRKPVAAEAFRLLAGQILEPTHV
jgi:ribose transport system substrate-binding protein